MMSVLGPLFFVSDQLCGPNDSRSESRLRTQGPCQTPILIRLTCDKATSLRNRQEERVSIVHYRKAGSVVLVIEQGIRAEIIILLLVAYSMPDKAARQDRHACGLVNLVSTIET